MKAFLKNIGLFLLLLLIFNHVIVWFYESPKRDSIKNNTYGKKLKWDAIKDDSQKFDLIFIGSSRVYNAYNPKVIDSSLHLNSINMGTGSQNIIESYYLLKEIFEHQKPKTIVYDLFVRSIEYNTVDYSHVLSNADYMSTTNKYDMVLNGFGAEGLMNLAFPLLQYKTYLKQSLVAEKGSHKPKSWYKGYSKVLDSLSNEEAAALGATVKFKDQKTAHKTVKLYLQKIQELCSNNNSKIICIRSPYPPSRLEKDPKGDAFLSASFKEMTSELDIPFYDFNYLENIYLNSDFFDFHHMNLNGSQKASRMLSKILSNQ